MADSDAGLADDNWKRFYTPEEVDEICRNAETTQFVSGATPIHVRTFFHDRTRPTIVMAHPMLPYGIMLARLQLPFFRDGFNVIQWDLPGWGQSGGARSGCPVSSFLIAWHDALTFTQRLTDGPIFTMGLAEDSVTCYYISANNPRVRAASLHTLHEYGDTDGVRWQGPGWLVRLKALGVGAGTLLRPNLAIDAHQALPWTTIFSHPDDGPLLQAFEDDPLRARRFEFTLAGSMMESIRPPVSFEDCLTPMQIIASEKSRLWPFEMNQRYFERLGGPKEFVPLIGKDQWEYTLAFHEAYAAHVIRWFRQHGAFESQISAAPHETREGVSHAQ
ncbi:MAG: hypothetical protein M3439_10380 [Chloroflexota bacterium]|nr:hypothetical protein [Chloroflexota bacterium]